MKKCPFCAEEIQDEAIKCKHCGEFMNKKPTAQWYFKTSILVLAILSVGPFALPLVWFNPRYSRTAKIIISGVVIVLSYLLYKAFMQSMQSLTEYYQLVF